MAPRPYTYVYGKRGVDEQQPLFIGAGYEARTRYLHLGKVALYQMSYTCKSSNKVYYTVFFRHCQASFLGHGPTVRRGDFYNDSGQSECVRLLFFYR